MSFRKKLIGATGNHLGRGIECIVLYNFLLLKNRYVFCLIKGETFIGRPYYF